MGSPHLVVDGSNIATEGRSMPSLQQLLDAVRAVAKELDPDNVSVIVDATFGHRIDPSERDAYEEATSTGEIITPPAGVIGRGDAFILEVADRADAIVLSNDSFQEFHGKYDWLFEEGRLLGGKHVPGVGWIFLARSPVRGPTSRRAVSDAKRKRRGSRKAASSGPKKSSRSGRARKAPAKAKVKAKTDAGGGDRRKSGGKEPEPYNEPLPFIEFVGAHPVGSTVEAEVEQFSSHGAYVLVEGTRCYVPLKALADPAPRSARDVLTLGETREFVVTAIDTPRRGIDLALPGFEGEEVTEDEVEVEEVEEEVEPASLETRAEADATPVEGDQKLSVSQRRKLRAQQAAAGDETDEPTETVRETMAQNKKAPAKKKAASKKRAAAGKAPAKRKSTAKRSTAGKTAARKSSPANRKTAAKKSPTKKKSAANKKSTARKSPAKKKSAANKKSTARKSPAKKKSTAKKSTARKSTAKKSTTRKSPAKRSTARKRS
jgi:hypothetical protein